MAMSLQQRSACESNAFEILYLAMARRLGIPLTQQATDELVEEASATLHALTELKTKLDALPDEQRQLMTVSGTQYVYRGLLQAQKIALEVRIDLLKLIPVEPSEDEDD
jgi:hypothetical protein